MPDAGYRYLVGYQTKPSTGHHNSYDGTDVADAMADFSRLVSEGVEYVTIEALKERA
jgi:hypothetical protein